MNHKDNEIKINVLDTMIMGSLFKSPRPEHNLNLRRWDEHWPFLLAQKKNLRQKPEGK